MLLAAGLGRVFLQPLVLLHHQWGEGHRQHHPLVVHQTQILLVVHHQCRERQWGEAHRHHHPLVVDHHIRIGHRHHHPLVVLVFHLLVGLEQTPQTEMVLGRQSEETTTAKMEESFQTHPVIH